MQFNWQMVIIVAAVLLGVCLMQMGQQNAQMNDDQVRQAAMNRMYAYILFAIAAAMLFYMFMYGNNQKASMYGGYANMCGAAHKAQLGAAYKANMGCGLRY